MRGSVYRDSLTIKEICKERRVYLSIDGKLTQIDPSSIEVDTDEEIIIGEKWQNQLPILEEKSTTEKQRSDIKAAITKAVNIIDRIVWKTYDK